MNTDPSTAPFMDDIRVASPCRANWDDMDGDERSRACAKCRKNVYNLSGMTRSEIVKLIREREGALCVRFYRRADGMLVTADCPPMDEYARHRRFTTFAAAASLALGLATAIPASSARPDNIFSKLVVDSIDRLKAMLGIPTPPKPPSAAPPGAVAMGEMECPAPPQPQPQPAPVTLPAPDRPAPPSDGGTYPSG